MVAYIARTSAEFELRAQLCTDLAAVPVEDAKVEWSQEQSPDRTVAHLVWPVQNAYCEERRLYMDERLAFSPVHALEAHRPLGSVNRSSKKVYQMTQAFRQGANGVKPAEPRSLSDVPDGPVVRRAGREGIQQPERYPSPRSRVSAPPTVRWPGFWLSRATQCRFPSSSASRSCGTIWVRCACSVSSRS